MNTIQIELERGFFIDEEGNSVHEFSCAGYLDGKGEFLPFFIHGFSLEEQKALQEKNVGSSVNDSIRLELKHREGYKVHMLMFVRTEGEDPSVKVRQRTYTNKEEWEASFKKEAPLLPNNLLPVIGKQIPWFKKWIPKLLNAWYGEEIFAVSFQQELPGCPVEEKIKPEKKQKTTAEPSANTFSASLPDPGRKEKKVSSPDIPLYVRVEDVNKLLKTHSLQMVVKNGKLKLSKVIEKVIC